MSSDNAIPLLLCGQIESHLKKTAEELLPEFEVVHIARTNEDAIAYLGSDPQPKPRVAIIGGQYSWDDFYQIQTGGAPLAKQIPWIRPEQTRPGSTQPKNATAKASPEVVVRSVKRLLLEKREVLAGNGAIDGFTEGDIWYYKLVE